MAIPTNLTAATAIEIKHLPFSATQVVDDGVGKAYKVFYKYTALDTEWVIAFFAIGDLVIYKPQTRVFTDPIDEFGVATSYPDSGQIFGDQRPVNVGVEGGRTYYFQVQPFDSNSTPAVLSVKCETAPCASGVPEGSLFIPNDTANMPATVISQVDNSDEILGYVQREDTGNDYPPSEQGDTSSGGLFLLAPSDSANLFKMYNPDGTFFQDITFPSVGALKVRTIKTSVEWDWAAAWAGGGGNSAEVVFISGNITVEHSDTVTLPLAGLTALAVSNDERLIYYSGQASSLNSEIKVWDRNVDAEIADLVADFGGTFKVFDILVMSDNSLVVLYQDSSKDTTIVQYDSAGVTLNTFALGTSFSGTTPRMTYDKNTVDTSFWVMLHKAGRTHFQQIRLVDGAVVAEIIAAEFSGGAGSQAITKDPDMFGVSPSCPVMLTGPNYPACPPIVIASAPTTFPIRRQRTAPHIIDENLWVFYHSAQLDCQTGTALLEGQGENPQVMLDWSDDGGHTWSQERWRTAGRTADYDLRVLWRRLGRSRDRIFRVTVTDPVAWRFIDFYLELSKGLH